MSHDLDLMSAHELVTLINDADSAVPGAVRAAGDAIARAVDAIAERLSAGGRLFYAGAGTSGRIAMLDASELPPTYGIPADLVQVIMAGGRDAYFSAVEGAEDREEDAIAEVTRLVSPDDALIGIAASGTTPFTVAAVRRANLSGALTVGVTSRRGSPLAAECDIPIVVETGDEVVSGSSRMKSGTAQKLVLNTISTAVMIRIGKVYRNLMVEMPPTNRKLHERAISMVQQIAGGSRSEVESALQQSRGSVKLAAVSIAKKVSSDEAGRILEQHGGSLREALAS